MSRTGRLLPFAAIIAASVLFGTTGTAKALAPVGASAASIGMLRIIVGGAILAAVAVIVSRRRTHQMVGKVPAGGVWQTWIVVLLGAIGVVGYQPAFFEGTEANGVALGTVVALGSAPLMTGLVTWLVTGVAPRVRWWLATAVAVGGVVLISQVFRTGHGAGGGVSAAGLAASAAAGLSYAVYTVAAKKLMGWGWTSSASMGAVFGLAAVIAVPAALCTDLAWLTAPTGWAVALWLGVATTGVAYVFFGWGLQSLPAPTVATVTLVEPLTAAVLGVVVLGETLGIDQVAGMGLLVLGVAILSTGSANAQHSSSKDSA